MEKDKTLDGKFTIVDAITDSTFQNIHYHAFYTREGFAKMEFKSLADVLNLPLDGFFSFAKDKQGLYLLRGISLEVDDEWTAAVLQEHSLIPIMKYPTLLKHYVNPWIKEHRREFSCYD